MSSTKNSPNSENPHVSVRFKIENPQIVNGCQTVNSIFSALKEYDDNDVEKQFQDTFVMLKILQIDTEDEFQKNISKAIVTYNNSQNSLDEKQFVANNELFQRLKGEFETKGFLLLTKQSDKETYSNQYKKKSELNKLQMASITRRQLFGLESLKKVTDFEIPLEKFLQVILAFKNGGLSAYTMKKDVLKPETQTYNTVIEFVKASNITTEVLLNLYLLYLRLEKEKKTQTGKFNTATPIPFYAIDGFSRFECGGDTSKIGTLLSSSQNITKLMKIYSIACNTYTTSFMAQNNTDYTKMIKAEIDYDLFSAQHSSAKNMFDMMSSIM